MSFFFHGWRSTTLARVFKPSFFFRRMIVALLANGGNAPGIARFSPERVEDVNSRP